MDNNFKGQPLPQGLHLGYITEVDEDERLYQVKTLRTDFILHKVKQMHLAWHKEGDDEAFLLKIGTYVIVGFIGPTPVILGVWPTGQKTSAPGSKHQELQLGDKIIQTESGSFFYMSAGGLIEAHSTTSCWWMMNPREHRFNMVTNNFELNTSGGLMFWNVDKGTKKTLYRFVAVDGINPKMGMEVKVGSTSDDPEAENAPVMDIAVGETKVSNLVQKKNLQIQVYSDGKTYLNIAQGKIELTMNPDGTIQLKTASTVTAEVGGDVNVKVSGKADVKVGGAANVNIGGAANVKVGGTTNLISGGDCTVKAPKIHMNGSSSGITTMNSHQGVIDLITGVPVQPSPTVLSDV